MRERALEREKKEERIGVPGGRPGPAGVPGSRPSCAEDTGGEDARGALPAAPTRASSARRRPPLAPAPWAATQRGWRAAPAAGR